MKTFANTALLCLTPFLLNACAPLGRESFSAEPGTGFGWRSMQENHQIIQQMGDHLAGQKPKILSLTMTPQPYLLQAGPLTQVQRAPEQVVRVWFAPYQDGAGNLHEEAALHTVVQAGQWLVPPFSLDEQPLL